MSERQHKTKHINKDGSSGLKKHPKHRRTVYNNDNPNNKLELNKFHQIKDNRPKFHQKRPVGQGQESGQSNDKVQANMSKRKRDLERMIKHCESKGMEVDIKKKEELAEIERDMALRRKKYENKKRKEYFLDRKYNNIKQIETRKVYKHLENLKEKKDEDSLKQIAEWQKKLRYIKHFPKNLKYISLFPTSKPLEPKAIEFQNKIMEDIEKENKRRVQKMNFYKSQNELTGKAKKQQKTDLGSDQGILPTTYQKVNVAGKKKTKKVVDDFFMAEQPNEEKQAVNQSQEENSADENQSEDQDEMIGVEEEFDEGDESSDQDLESED